MKCEFCDYETDNIRALNGHKRIHVGKTRVIVCENCGDKYNLNQFEKHRKICDGTKKNERWKRRKTGSSPAPAVYKICFKEV
jgi:hypothetical protein